VTGSSGLIIGPGANAAGFLLFEDSFPDAQLQGIDFRGTDFFDVDMANDNLTGADLTGAVLGGVYQGLNGPVDLTGATLTDTDLEGAQLGDSELTGVISGGITGTPGLPTHWGLFEGYLRTATVLCSEVTGSAKGSISFKKCTPNSVDNSSASLAGSSLDSAGTLIWSPSGQTTNVSFSSSSPGRGLCGVHRTEVDVSGPVVGGNSAYTGSDDWVSMQLCEKKSGLLRLAPNTTTGL
jgi:Pentapeptide repeats (8 copies)